MTRGQTQQQEYTSGVISGNRYSIGGNVATRAVPPGARIGREVHVTTPHPDPRLQAKGWRMAWIFLASILGIICCVMYGLGQSIAVP